MDEIIKKLNELRELIKKHDEIISLNVVNIRDSRRAEILVDDFQDVPKKEASFTKLPKDIGRWEKSVIVDGVKFEAYCSYETVIEEIKKEEGIIDEAGDAEND